MSAPETLRLGDGPDACLLLHGFSGAPSELQPVAERLARAGMRCLVPLLPGHGKTALELHQTSRAQLREAARAALQSLTPARNIFLVGLSAGAMLALELAAHLRMREGDPKLSALALLAPAARFTGTTWIYANALGRLPLPRAARLFLNKGRRDVASGTIEPISRDLRSDGSLTRVPISWGRELRLLSREALGLAPRVRAPTLVLQGEKDQTAAPSGARLLAARLGSRELETRFFPESGHVLPIDRDGPAVCDAVADFFARHAEP